jgi:hypothetical protein
MKKKTKTLDHEKHLKSLFSKEGWTIDFIRSPLEFDLTDPEQFEICCHHTNLTPRFPEDINTEQYTKAKKYLNKKQQQKLAEVLEYLEIITILSFNGKGENTNETWN